MKKNLLIVSVLLIGSFRVPGQDVPGLSYCLLFESVLEKQAFEEDKKAGCDPLVFFLAYDSSIDSVRYFQIKDELNEYLEKLGQKKSKFKSDVAFLHYVFSDVHRKYLKEYSDPALFNGLFNSGRYNCVSGVALYTTLLKQLGYTFDIYETRFHLFLTVQLGDSRVLVESTDPFDGFVSNESRIQERIKEYLINERKRLSISKTIAPPFNSDVVRHQISLKELSGLHYYNIGVNYFNKENYLESLKALKKAAILYPSSKRIQDLLHYAHNKYEAEISVALN